MSVKVASNLFIVPSFEKWGKFYQHLVSSIADFQRLGIQLVWEAQKAQALRQIDKLEEISAILSNFPIREYRLIGQYHLGWCASRKGKDSRAIFENVIENSTTYRSMALIDLATLELSAGNCDSATKFCTEAIRQSSNISTIVNAARSIAVIQSAEGFHTQALKGLQAIAPITRHATLIARYQYLNSLAVEYGEAGKVQEAQRLCRIVLASPFLHAYPEWRETGEEIALRGYRQPRSVVSFALKPAPDNVLQLPDRCLSSGQGNYTPSPLERKASIVNLENWKKKMGKKTKNGEDKKLEPLEDMTRQDMAMNILEIITHNSEDEIKLRKLLEYARELYSKPDKADK